MLKKSIVFALCFVFMLAGVVSAHDGTHEGGASGDKALTIYVNGVEVVSSANHIMEGKAYVSIQAFAKLFHKDYTSKSDSSVEFNGKTISGVHVKQGVATAWIRDLADAVNASKVSWDAEYQDAYVLVLPEGVVPLDGGFVVPAMGEHWADPKYLPNGPIFGVHNGQLVFIEYMISQEDFKNGVNHRNLPGIEGIPTPSIVQTDIEFQAKGHPGFEIPHFDIHAYYITDEEQQAIK